MLEAEWKFLHMAQRMRVKGLRKLRVLSSLQAFALSLIGSVCFSALINNAAAIHSNTVLLLQMALLQIITIDCRSIIPLPATVSFEFNQIPSNIQMRADIQPLWKLVCWW